MGSGPRDRTEPRPEDSRRAAAERLAELLGSEEGLESARLLQLLGTLDPRPPDAASDRRAPVERIAAEILRRAGGEAPVPIGIWRPESSGDDTVFVRDDAAPYGHWWSPRRTLEPKRSLLPLRVCLLGESTAAGWFYAPTVTPARVLGEQLRAVRPGVYEVIDLTMVNQQAAGLLELAGAVQQLTPDVLVLFAGNNWPQHLPTHPNARLADSQQAALALREGGAAGLARLCRDRTRRSAEDTLDTFAAIAGESGIPVVVVVPEVNLADWDRRRPVAWLPGDGSGRWHELRHRALSYLREGNAEAAAEACEEMVALDGGSCSTSLGLLAWSRAAAGREREAGELQRAACDARAWDNFPATPSATGVVQEILRERSRQHDLFVVDLPAVFARHLGSRAAGRTLFLDYCHLTVEGMQIAMAAVAAEVLRLADPAGDGAIEWSYLASSLPAPSVEPRVDAQAKFMTALYNAHYGGASLARFWLEAAVASWSGVQEAMLAYVATRGLALDALPFSRELARFYESVSSLERQSAYQPTLDAEVVETILDVLSRSGRPAPEAVHERFLAGHGAGRRSVDLVRAAYHWRILDRLEDAGGFARERYLYHRARWPASDFCLVASAEADLELAITVRLPAVDGPRSAPVAIRVNGQSVGTIEAAERWGTRRVRIERSTLRRGFNRVGLHWPALPPAGDAAIARNVKRLELGVPVDLHPVFGEVYALVVRGDAARTQ